MVASMIQIFFFSSFSSFLPVLRPGRCFPSFSAAGPHSNEQLSRVRVSLFDASLAELGIAPCRAATPHPKMEFA